MSTILSGGGDAELIPPAFHGPSLHGSKRKGGQSARLLEIPK
jgi:hypothetical protein